MYTYICTVYYSCPFYSKLCFDFNSLAKLYVQYQEDFITFANVVVTFLISALMFSSRRNPPMRNKTPIHLYRYFSDSHYLKQYGRNCDVGMMFGNVMKSSFMYFGDVMRIQPITRKMKQLFSFSWPIWIMWRRHCKTHYVFWSPLKTGMTGY